MRTVITTHQTITYSLLLSLSLTTLLYQLNCVLNRDENRNNKSSDHHLFLVVVSLTHNTIISNSLTNLKSYWTDEVCNLISRHEDDFDSEEEYESRLNECLEISNKYN